jgi:hypothetical protein
MFLLMEECAVKGRAHGSRGVVSILAQTVCEHAVPHLAFNMAIIMCGVFPTVNAKRGFTFLLVWVSKRVVNVYARDTPP